MKNITALSYIQSILGEVIGENHIKLTEKQALEMLINSHKRMREYVLESKKSKIPSEVKEVLDKAEKIARMNLKDIVDLVSKTTVSLKNHKTEMFKKVRIKAMENILKNYTTEEMRKRMFINYKTAMFEFKK